MALRPLQAGIENYGQFDGYDSDIFGASPFKGGEVCTFTYVSVTGSDATAQSVDGYYTGVYPGVSPAAKLRPAITKNLVSGTRPLFLSDEGTSFYGTMFGELVGTVAGQGVPVPHLGTQLGPHTAAGSGKITVWAKPGLYAVTLDAVDTAAVSGLQPTNPTITGGCALYAKSTGQLTPGNAYFENYVVARFIEFQTNGSLVTTPASLVGGPNGFAQAVIHWNPGQ